MSHYIVAVITQDGTIEEIESLLAPFDENISVDEYIGRTKEQMIKKFKTGEYIYQDPDKTIEDFDIEK